MGRRRGVRIDAGADTIDVAKTFGELRRGGAQVNPTKVVDRHFEVTVKAKA